MDITNWIYGKGGTAFGSFVTWALQVRGLKQSQFAKAIGLSQGFVSLVCVGRKSLGSEHVELWADALQLDPGARELFRNLAAAAAVPPLFRARIERLAMVSANVPGTAAP